jgi:hypothetical protein
MCALPSSAAFKATPLRHHQSTAQTITPNGPRAQAHARGLFSLAQATPISLNLWNKKSRARIGPAW